MAQFTNQAQLSYRNVVTSSNIAVGEILEALTITKTALTDTYGAGDTVAYIISIINSGATPLTSLTISDDLGAYEFGAGTLTPLSYVEDSVKYYVDGILQEAPSVNGGAPLMISGITVNGSGNTIIAYEASVNAFAPPTSDGSITNTATLSGNGITPIEASEVITSGAMPTISITKTISPVPVSPNGLVSYTFVIENRGNTPLVATDNSVITDIFDPILSNISVTFNGEDWQEGENYTYNESTGEFATASGQVIVEGASFSQSPTSGAWTINPGVSTLVVTGNIGTIG